MNVGREIAVLKHMTMAELRARYAEVFGEESRSRHKDFLVKRIAWRLQSQAEGDLSGRARARAAELANDADIRMSAPRRSGRSTSPPTSGFPCPERCSPASTRAARSW